MEHTLTTTIDCGVESHDEHCLCDVVVKEPTPIRYGLHELDHAALVIKYKNLGAPWDGEQLAKLLDGLDRAREAADMVRQYQLDPQKLSTYTQYIKSLVRKGQSMVDIPAIVGLSLEDTATALTSGRATRLALWNEADWLAFEADVLDGVGVREISRRHNLAASVSSRLVRLYRGD